MMTSDYLTLIAENVPVKFNFDKQKEIVSRGKGEKNAVKKLKALKQLVIKVLG